MFGPYGHRMERKLTLSGISIGRDGVLRQVELHGPATISIWLASYKVIIMTILTKVSAVALGVLTMYRNHIEKLHDRYSSKTLSVIYQAESRCRLEHMDRLRREAVAEHDEITKNGGISSFDPKRPWNTAWRKAIHDKSSMERSD